MWPFKKKGSGTRNIGLIYKDIRDELLATNFWLVPNIDGCDCPLCTKNKEIIVSRWWDDMKPGYATVNGKSVICP